MQKILAALPLAVLAAPALGVDPKQTLSSEAFLGAHPDLNFRLQGHAEELWEPKLYRQGQEKTWNAPSGGTVDVGPRANDTH